MLLPYLLLMNAIGLLLMHSDKQRAKKKSWRISEATLIGLTLLGGSVGILFGMQFFRHKTRKPMFYAGVPFVMMIQFLLILLKLGA